MDSTEAAYPAVPYASWTPTKETLHRFVQILGKVRLAASPPRNHWWNVPLHLTGRGLTTRPMSTDPVVTIDLDLIDHRASVNAETGDTSAFPLIGQSVASFYAAVQTSLAAVGAQVAIAHPRPFDLPDAKRAFADDTEHHGYDPVAVHRYWRVLGRVNLLLEEAAGEFTGKISPVHHFWHTFDIAVTRFSDRPVEQPPGADAVTREAYSHEVISSGFWFGDESYPAPAFYSYTAPEPDGLAGEPLEPYAARWVERGASHLAVLDYDDARATGDVRAAVLAFYRSTYLAGARRAGWDLEALTYRAR